MSDLRGKLRQKSKDGPYYYRLMVANGVRKEISLKTCDYEEACQKAADLDAVWEAPNRDVAIAQINAIKGFSKQAQNLPFDEAWRKYEKHPNRATPHTIAEQIAYQKCFQEFIRFVSALSADCKKQIPLATGIGEVTPANM